MVVKKYEQSVQELMLTAENMFSTEQSRSYNKNHSNIHKGTFSINIF